MVTIIKQSGKPIDESEAEKFMEEWKTGFEKLFESETDMETVSKKADAYEEKLREKYNLEKVIQVPKSMKAWKNLLKEHDSSIMVDVHVKTGKLLFIILDQGIK
tara:strand:+ start:2455 stop:2766 length:312 start_codon:yes stop_codon:yes gene_type:complete